MGHRVVTPPTGLPIDIEIVLSHLLMDDDVSDAQKQLIELYVGGAVTHIETTCEHAIARQTWMLELDSWDHVLRLPGGNVLSVGEVSYVDAAGDRQVVDPEAYLTRLGICATVRPRYGASWPTARNGEGGIEVTYDVGYDEADVPKPLQQAILLLVGDADVDKGTKKEGQWAESQTVKRLLWPYKAMRV